MTYFDVDSFRSTTLSDVQGVSLVYTTDDVGTVVLVGSSDPAYACPLEGHDLGQFFESRFAPTWHGYAFEKLVLEVDSESKFSPDGTAYPIFSVIRHPQSLFLMAKSGATNSISRMLIAGSGRTDQANAMGFTRWRLVRLHNDRREVVYTMDAEERAPKD